MFCRRMLQRLGPLARRATKPSDGKVAPARLMSYGIPGGSTNMTYFVLCGGGLTAAVVYAYKTINGDSERYNDRLADMGSKTKVAKAAEAAVAPAEAAAVQEAAPAAEPVPESLAAPAEPQEEAPTAEPVAELAAELSVTDVAAASAEEVEEAAAAASEADVPAEEAAAEEPAAAAEEPALAVEDVAAEVTPAQSAECLPGRLAAVKVLAGSTGEIAAASVAEAGGVSAAARQTEEHGTGAPGVEVLGPDAKVSGDGEETATVVAEEEEEAETTPNEADGAVADEERPGSAGAAAAAAADAADAPAAVMEEKDIPCVEEVSTGETPAAVAAEEGEVAPEEAAVLAPSLEEVAEADAPLPGAPSETTPAEEAAHTERVAPAEETLLVEAPVPAETVEADEAAAEASGAGEAVAVTEPVPEAATWLGEADQLAAAACPGSDAEILPAAVEPAPVKGSGPCHSCHSLADAEEAVALPADLQGAGEGSIGFAQEGEEAASQMEGPVAEAMTTVRS